MEEAHYFHGTLYQFNKEAREAVIAAFSAKVQNVSARCHYDIVQDLFCLTCPTGVGVHADEVLRDVLLECVKRELASTADGEPRIRRFAASRFDNLDASTEPPSQPLTEPTSPSTTKRAAPLTIHHVFVEDVQKTVLAFYVPRDLPAGMLERILAADHPSSTKMLAWGLICRAVRWSPADEDHVFNGRIGKPIPATATSWDEEDIISSTKFARIGNVSGVDGDITRSKHVLAGSSNYAHNPTAVQQFLEGMSAVQPEAPDYMPAPPRDAESFQRRNNVSMPRRARGPLYPVAAPINSDSESSDDRDSDSTSSAQQPHPSNQSPGKNQLAVPTTNGASKNEHHNWNRGLSMGQAATPLRPANEATPIIKGSANNPGTQHASSSSETNGRSSGLISNATNSAQWSIDTQLSPMRRLNRRGIVRRDAPSTIAQNLYAPSTSSTGVRSAHQADVPAWTNGIHRDVPMGNLIDDTAPATAASIKPPPGYNQQACMALSASHSPQTRTTNTEPDEDEPLIDLNGSETENSRPFSRPSGSHNRQPASASRGMGHKQKQSTPKDYDDDPIIERLQDDELASNFKKYTMRQQKGKKHRNVPAKAKEKVTHSHADLPKPDPLPAPKKSAKKSESETTASSSMALAAGSSDQDVVEADSRITKREASIADPSIPPTTQFGKLVQELLLEHDKGDTQITVQFGTVLIKPLTDKSILTGVHTAGAVERKLQAGIATNFLPRMTTSEDDARFMLSLFGGGQGQATVTYEVEIKNAEGAERIIKFDQTEPQNFLVLHTNNALGVAYIHHPLRVWDAKVSIERPEVDVELMQMVQGFVASIQTIGMAPSFQASVPAGSFSVENVYAKRHFSKSIANEIKLEVTEVQHLVVASTATSPFNLQASIQPTAAMIEGQRLWWEAGMYAPTADMPTADKLQSLATTYISQIDGVGLNNSGPFRWAEIEEPAPVEVQFW